MSENETLDKYGFFGGDQCSSDINTKSTDIEKIRRRESKWLEILTNWDFYVSKKFDKIRNKCRKGIPEGIRARVWQYLCGSRQEIFKLQGKYQELLALEGDKNINDQIMRDVGRQYCYHELFATGSKHSFGQQSLFNVLKAYSILYPVTGYCQAQAPIAAALLIHMPEEEAFWTFCSICQNYLPAYFDQGLERVQLDSRIFYGLVKRHLPNAYRHLVQLEVEPVYFMVDWFMCIFTRSFPWATVVRILDMFFCEGIKVIFRVAMAVVKHLADVSSVQYNSTESLVHALRNIPAEFAHPDFIIRESMKFAAIPASEFIYEHLKQQRLSSTQSSSQI